MRTRLVAAFFLVAAATRLAAAPAPVAVPSTPAGIVFAEWLSAYNSADREALQAFKDKYKRETPVEETLRWREETGGYELLAVDGQAPRVLRAVLKERDSDDAYQATFSVTADDPPGMATFALEPTALPPDRAVRRLSEADAVAAVAARATALADGGTFAGAVLIARGDQVLLERAWGLADRAKRTPNAVDTQFRIGSMNKMFTAVAILQLIEAGKLALDDTVGEHLPDYADRDTARKVTVRQLLTHSGGTGDIFGPEFDAHRDELATHDDYRKLYEKRPPDFAPGSDTRYSNYGFVLLGLLVEKASGQSYYDYVDAHIYARAGMTASGSEPESSAVPKRSVGYMKDGGEWVTNAGTLPHRGMAAGGGYSTVRDLHRFARALADGKLVSKALVAQATRAQNDNPGYGWGFAVRDDGTLRRYGHGGGAPGMNGELQVYPDTGYVVVALSNLDPPAAQRMAEFFAHRMPLAE